MSMADRTSRTIPAPPTTATTNTTSYSTVSINSTQRPNREMEIPEHKTLNNTLVSMNEASSTTWKLSGNHTSPPYITRKYVRIARPFYFGD